MKNICVLLFSLSFMSLSAQMTDELTKVLNKVKGEAVFEIEANQTLYAYPSDDGWHKVSREAWIPVADLLEDKFIGEGTELLNKDGDKIGKILKEMKVSDKRLVEGFRGKDRYVIVVEGYLFKTKFKKNSFPERRVDELLALKNRTEQVKGFKALFEQYNFVEKEYGDLTAFVMREDNKNANEEKDFRIIIIYRGSSTVYGVLTNDHRVTAPKIKATFEDDPYHGIYMYKPPAKQKALIEEEMMYDFIAL